MSDQESSEKANVIDGCQPKQASEFRKVGDPSFSLVPPQEVFVDGVIGQGHNIMMQDKPCKVVEMKTSKPGRVLNVWISLLSSCIINDRLAPRVASLIGKHGHGPVKFTAIDVFTGKRYEAIQEWTHPMLTFDSDKKEYSVKKLLKPMHSLLYHLSLYMALMLCYAML